MNQQQKCEREAGPMGAKELLKNLLDQRGMAAERLEAKTLQHAVAHVQFPSMGIRTVLAEVADEDSVLWCKDSRPGHSYRIAHGNGISITAAKAKSIKESFACVSFSPDGRNALLFLAEDLQKKAAAEGEEAAYVLPVSCCLILHRHGRPQEG